MFSDSKVTVELTVADGKLTPSPAPTQFVEGRVRGAPDGFGEQETSAASAGLGVSATPETAIAAPATIGSRIVRAFARPMPDVLPRRLLRRPKWTSRAMESPLSGLGARERIQARKAPLSEKLVTWSPPARPPSQGTY